MSNNLFGPSSKDDIRVGYISTDTGYVTDITICEANTYAQKNPGTTFIFRNGNNNIQYLSNVRNGVKGINTNIDLSMNTTKMKVTLKDGNFTKYIKMITNYGSKDSSKDSIYIKLDTT